MTAVQVYEKAIEPLSTEDKLVIARFIINEVVPEPASAARYMPAEGEESGFEYLKRLLPHIECISLTQQDLDSVVLEGLKPPCVETHG